MNKSPVFPFDSAKRIRPLLTFGGVATFFSVYCGLLLGFALYRYLNFIESSVWQGEFVTVTLIFLSLLKDVVPDTYSYAWMAGFFIISLNATLIAIYIRRVRSVSSSFGFAGLGLGGLGVFMFGLGCLSCGAVAGVFLASIVGAGLLPALFQWGGVALVTVGLILLCVLTLILFKKVTDPFVC